MSERATIIVPRQDESIRKEVFAALETEGKMLKASEERIQLDMRSLLKEERSEREREC